VAASLGVRNSSRMTLEKILITIGQLSKIGVVVHNAKNAITVATAAGCLGKTEKRYNTIVRLINVVFAEGYVDGLLKWNDQRN
jgi:hypothetical protein